MTLNISLEEFNQYKNNYPKNEEKYLNDSLDLNTYNNNFKNDNYVESDEISDIYKLYFISPKELAQKETEAIQNMKNNEIVEKKEENSEKNEQKNNSPIILVDKNCIPSEEIIDRKGKNNKKKNKKRYTEKTEKTACSSEINEEPQNQLNQENEKVSELNEINKEENNVQLIIVDKKEESKISNNNDNINVSNNDDNSEMNDISHIQANNIESNGNNIINNTNAQNNNNNSEVNDIDRIQTNNIALNRINEENNFNIIINSDNHDTDTNSNKYKNLIDKKRKRGKEFINELNEYNPDKILRKIRTMSLRTVIIFINEMIKIIYNNDIRKSILIRQFLEINKKELSHSSVEFDKKFLYKELKEILSENISEKYSNFPPDKNKRLVEELITSENGGRYFQKLFELTFLDCLEHIRGTKKFSELMGLMDIDAMLNYEEFKIDKDQIQTYEDYIYEYENIIKRKKSRNSKYQKI
jgi:hypothetical protein